MSYSSITNVRRNLNLESYEPSDAIITSFIARADVEIDEKTGGANLFVDTIEFQKNSFIKLSHDFYEIKEITINGVEMKEFNTNQFLPDGEVEDDDGSDAPLYWNENESTGDTLTWDNSYQFSLNRSLKIAKGGASASYWYSDDETIDTKEDFKVTCRIKVDSNSSANTYLKLLFLDADESTVKTYTSSAVTIEITQPAAAGTVSIASDNTDDTSQSITIDGLVSGIRDVEVIELNGTTSVAGIKSFSYIYGVRKSDDTEGIVIITRGSTVCTLTAKESEKADWIEAAIEGSSTHDSQTAQVQLYVDSATGTAYGDHFSLRKRNWRPLAAQKTIYLIQQLVPGDVLDVTYLRSEVSKLVKELSRDIASLYVLAFLSGAKTSSVNYEDLKNIKIIGAGWSGKQKVLIERIESNLHSLTNYDNKSPDFSVRDLG